jgi:polyferredoxin
MKKQRKRFSILQISRLLIQIVFFIFLPSLYIGALNGIKEIYLAIIHLSFSTALLPQIIEVIAVIPISIFLGRFFCGWMCAFGSFSDFIYSISHNVWKKKWKVSEQADAWMKFIKYAILAVLVAAVWSFNIILFSTASPWDVFGMLATVGKAPDFSYVITNLTVGFVIFIGIVAASTVIERFFCRYLCPMGAIFAIVSKLRIAKIKKPSAQCGNCRACTNNCSMGIPLYKMDEVSSGECINCMKCVTACPRGNTDFTIAQKDVRPLMASAAAVAAITGMYYTGSFTMNTSVPNTVTVSGETGQSASANKIYNDGTYEGTGSGFRGGTTKVSVTIKNDKISSISTISHEDTREFYDRAYPFVSQETISTQSSQVDAVSGATYSSNGIMEAVADALNQAKISGVSSDASSVSVENS